MADNTDNLFTRLTKLFRNGPSVRRKVRNYKPVTAGEKLDVFGYGSNNIYNAAMSSYGSFDRMSRYSDFSEMEATPEIASALDIYAEESTSVDERGQTLHIHSDNRKIKDLLENLFFDVLNVEFNLTMWVRNLCKYGDFFLFLEVDPEYGVTNVYPIPIAEMEREEGWDPENPSAVRFNWLARGASLENWQVAHFRLLGNDAFLPYGSSVLESARRIWRQLILIEDAMLVYRVIRAPERRVFYIDVGNVSPEDIPTYMKAAQDNLKRNKIIDKTTGRVDLRYNPMSVDEDYFLPVRGGESGTRIDTLAGGTNASDIEDVEYIQKKLFAALKIPRAYLGYDEDVGAKATLAQEDIRFSRAIQRIQKTIISELNKIAIIHLYSHGFTDEDLLDFDLMLSNPSSIAQMQKLELIKTKFDIAAAAPDGVVDRNWVRKNVMGLTKSDIEKIEEGRVEDKITDLELEQVKLEEEEAPEDVFGGAEEPAGEEGGGGETDTDIEDIFSADTRDGVLLTSRPSRATAEEDEEEDDDVYSIDDDESPIRAQSRINNVFGRPLKKKRDQSTSASSGIPNFAKMVSVGSNARTQDSMRRPFGNMGSTLKLGEADEKDPYEDFLNKKTQQHAIMSREIEGMVSSLGEYLGIGQASLLKESESDDD